MSLLCTDYLHIDYIQSIRFDHYRFYKGKLMGKIAALF